KYLNQQISGPHAVRRFGQIAIFLKDAFDIATLNCSNEGRRHVPVTEKRKHQRIEPGFVEKQIDGELPLAHEPARLVENGMEAGPNLTQIQQTQAIIGFEIERPSYAFDRGTMIADPS